MFFVLACVAILIMEYDVELFCNFRNRNMENALYRNANGNRKGSGQTVQMHSLTRAFSVCHWAIRSLRKYGVSESVIKHRYWGV